MMYTHKEVTYTTIFGHMTQEEAFEHAHRVVGEPVAIIGVNGSFTNFGVKMEAVDNARYAPLAYFVVPNGQRCPCCGGIAQLKKEEKAHGQEAAPVRPGGETQEPA